MRLLAIACVILLATTACTPAPSPPGRRAAQASGTPSPIPARTAPRTRVPARSDYTSLAPRDCRQTTRDAETGATGWRCPGIGGFALDMHDADARMSLDVVAGEAGTPQPLALSMLANGAFSRLGERAEWRFEEAGQVPTALIVRHEVYEDPAQPQRPTSYLLVVKLDPVASCAVARIAPGAGQNEDARRAADGIRGAACLWSTTGH